VDSLFVLLGSEPGVGVGDADVELLSALHDQLSLLRGNGVGDLGGVDAVLHQQHLQVRHVVNQKFLETIRTDVLGVLIASVTNIWHFVLALEASSHSVVNTLWFPPVGLHAEEVNRLMSDELLRPLLHNFLVIQRPNHFR